MHHIKVIPYTDDAPEIHGGKEMKRLIVALAILLFSTQISYASTLEALNGLPLASLFLGDPVDASNGALRFTLPLLHSRGPMDLHFSLLYGSDFESWKGNAFFASQTQTYWWSPWCAAYLGGDLYQFWLEDFRKVAFDSATGEIDESHQKQPVRYKMRAQDAHVYLMDPIRERVYVFGKPSGDILYILDRNGNRLHYTYDNRLTKLDDGLGREVNFTYTTFDNDRVLTQVTDQGGRSVFINYEENAPDNNGRLTLRSVTDASGQQTTLGYTPSNYVVTLQKPVGNTPYTQTWQNDVSLAGTLATRVVSQTTAYGHTTEATYDAAQNRVTETRPDNTAVAYTHYGENQPPKSVTDATGKAMGFTESNHAQPTGVTDRMGDTTTVAYHAETGKIASITNNKGDTIANTYTAQQQTFTNPDNNETVDFTFYNLTRIDYPDGTNEQFTHGAGGNILTGTNSNGKTWSYTYNGKGQVLTITNPACGVTTYTYNADTTIASATDSDTGTTTYEYDAYMRVKKIIHPDTTFVETAYDLNNRVTSVTDELSHAYTYAYDANGNLTSSTDPANKASQYAHDLMDRVTEITNRLGKKSQLAYDNIDRLESSTDPNGNKTQYAYNSHGWMDRVTDASGNVWQTGYDDEGLSVSETTPLGRTTTIARSKLGYVTGVTDPLNHNITLTRDTMSRITAFTDPMGRQTTYGYDGNGLLTSVTLPVAGAAQYTRNDLGLLHNIQDLNGSNWAFTHTNMGRLGSMTDPLANQWQYAYDQRGRLNQVTYPSGATQARTLDGAGNVTAKTYSQGPTLNYTHDDLDRMLTANSLSFTYNATGQVLSTTNPGTTFDATYDDGGRILTATYANGLFSVTYTYDERNLLTRVTDSLTNTTLQFIHDDDGRLTAMTRSSGINTAFALDNASRITRIQHGTLGDLQYTYNAAGEVTGLDYDLPLDPADYINAGIDTFTYDAASQVSTTGYTHDARGRMTTTPTNTFAWNGASRLTATSNATLTYNGLDDLLTREADGTTLHSYYNYALDLKPMVAEKNDTTAQWARFYVLTPGGRLLYMIDASDNNKVYFYHYNSLGNTLFLTDSTGAVTDSYAYSPYGNLLAHTGDNDQPFTFVGAWQIRQEGDGSLYQMRARYYEATTARFISREPLWPRIAEVQTLNPYQYAMQNPFKHVDKRGSYEEDISSDLEALAWVGLCFFTYGLSDDEQSLAVLESWNAASMETRMDMLNRMGTVSFHSLWTSVNYDLDSENIKPQYLESIKNYKRREGESSIDAYYRQRSQIRRDFLNRIIALQNCKQKMNLEHDSSQEATQSVSTKSENSAGDNIADAESLSKRHIGKREAAKKLSKKLPKNSGNPIHKIEWTSKADDNCGDGIGSRFFQPK